MSKKENKENKSKEVDNKPKSVLRELLEWVGVIVVAIVLALFLDNFIIVNAIIPSASMETTIMTGDHVIGNRLSYISKDPQRGDIVIFQYPDDESQLYIKRIIGMPGDTLEVIDGKVYINNSSEPLNEDYLSCEMEGSYGPITVPEGAYFMMGDNRNNSLDSRYWNQPFVYKEKIKGKAVVRIWPNPSIVEDEVKYNL